MKGERGLPVVELPPERTHWVFGSLQAHATFEASIVIQWRSRATGRRRAQWLNRELPLKDRRQVQGKCIDPRFYALTGIDSGRAQRGEAIEAAPGVRC